MRRTPFQILSIVLNNHLLVQLLWSLARKVFSDGLCFLPWVIATSLFLDCNLRFSVSVRALDFLDVIQTFLRLHQKYPCALVDAVDP